MKKREISFLDLGSGALFNPPRVFITLQAMKKIQCFTLLASGEINGLGSVEKRGNDFIITDAFILKQKTSATSAEIDPMALNKYVGECEDPSKLTFHWHSHVNMTVGFSPDDIGTIAGWLGNYMINLVINKKGDYICRLDLFKPFHLGLKVPLLVILPLEQELLSNCWKEIDSKVEEAGKLSKLARKVLNRDTRFSNRTQEEQPATVALEDLDPKEEGEE